MQGQYDDGTTGLYYNTFRYYDADAGRFTAEDPIGLAGGDNLYQYAPNPMAWVDPAGLVRWDVVGNGATKVVIGSAVVLAGLGPVSLALASTTPWFGIPLGMIVNLIGVRKMAQGILEIFYGCADKEPKDIAHVSSLAAFIASDQPILDALAGVIRLAPGVTWMNSLSMFTNPNLASIAAGDGEFWLGLDE
jgi:RHS repeat-associated protein